MPKVLVLPDHIASQIAAGEVVERPSSVVKELVENSLDAGATQIEVAIASNCRDIRIADNGCGMAPEDAVLAFQRHATSKISSADDLWTLTSFGFRGEAVPSIASISKFTCTTRTHDAAAGSRVESADGKVTCVQTGCAPGTIMEITDLFYNVPARLNFLKKASTEFGHIEEILQGLAIAHPEVSFTLTQNGQVTLRTTGSGDLAQVLVETKLLSGREALFDVDYEDSRHGIRIFGKVARPLHFRGDRKGIMSMVNRRPVRCHLTYKALDYAYSDLIPRGRYPRAVVAIELDPKHVDVNIHPTKKEIKYSIGNEVYLTIQRAIVQALRGERELAIAAAEQNEANAYARSSYTSSPAEESQPVSLPEFATSSAVANSNAISERSSSHQISFREQLVYAPPFKSSRPASVAEISGADNPTEDFSPSVFREDQSQKNIAELPQDWRIVGYLRNTYILLETSEGLIIVEQHIAHERTLYERLLASQETAGRITDHSQKLVVSVPLTLTTEQSAVLRQHVECLNKLGFGFDFDDNGSAVCSEVPLELAGKPYAGVVQELLDQLSITDNANIELEATKSLACQAAIKNGMPLGERDIRKLLIDWFATPRNDTCPHGRPICLKFSYDTLFQLYHPA